MNQYVTGEAIRALREQCSITQAKLARELNVSDKTVSKWETGKGYPDITMLESLAISLKVSVAELISGNPVSNQNQAGNMLRTKFYVCPVCGNVLHALGEAAVHCHGILLKPEEEENEDTRHSVSVERIEDEYYIQIDHDMTKQHYISFVAAISSDRIQLIKLYPEGNAQARFKSQGVRKICFFCNRDGMFSLRTNRIIR